MSVDVCESVSVCEGVGVGVCAQVCECVRVNVCTGVSVSVSVSLCVCHGAIPCPNPCSAVPGSRSPPDTRTDPSLPPYVHCGCRDGSGRDQRWIQDGSGWIRDELEMDWG